MGSMQIYQVSVANSNSKFQSFKGLVATVQEVITTQMLINDHITIACCHGCLLDDVVRERCYRIIAPQIRTRGVSVVNKLQD